jgi:4-amino-4-deoxy-L-arabinose transferase-like glycosyltransferase
MLQSWASTTVEQSLVDDRAAAETHYWFLRLVLVLTALLAMRIVALAFNATDLFFDEAQYWTWSRELAFGYYSKPPLVAWIIAGSTSLCGDSEFCIRLPSPVLHTMTALTTFWLASRLYGPREGFWTGVVFAMLPGVAFSANIISTDVPLLFLWAVALYALCVLMDTRRWWPALLLGVSLGFGLNAKYAMAYFVVCTVVYAIATPAHRSLLAETRWWAAIIIAVGLITPNLLWNVDNGFATLDHTVDNANWSGPLFRPDKAVEFFAAQFGVFGPILFVSLLIISYRGFAARLSEPDRLLLAFALPVILIVIVQSFISRAHANWAAVSYVAATPLVVATMFRDGARGWFHAALAVHFATMTIIMAGFASAGSFVLPGGKDPYMRTLGWKEIAAEVRRELTAGAAAGRPFRTVVATDRALTAELLYYLRATPIPILRWRPRESANDHYQLTRPFTKRSPEPVLLVALGNLPKAVSRTFELTASPIRLRVPAGLNSTRTLLLARAQSVDGQ